MQEWREQQSLISITDLLLWINHQWPTSTSRHQNGILCRHLIFRQPVGIPLPNLKRIGENIYHRHASSDRDFQLLASLSPVLDKFLTICAGECAVVGDAGSRYKDVTNNIAYLDVKILLKDEK